MKAKWIICNLGKDDHIRSLFYGVQECGRTAEVLSIKEFYDLLETPSDERACVVTSGSIWANTYVRKQRPNWCGNWHDESNFTCSRYYSYLGDHITQQEYVMLPFAEMLRRQDWLFQAFGVDDEIFIRPDSGAKEFCGEVISRARMASWAEFVSGGENWRKDLLCIVGRPKRMDREFRLVVKRGKVATGSIYRFAKHIEMTPLDNIEDQNDIINFAESVLAEAKMPLPPVYVLDIADSEGKLSVLEIGCFCCAGLYECDRRKIALAVSEAAEEEFEHATV